MQITINGALFFSQTKEPKVEERRATTEQQSKSSNRYVKEQVPSCEGLCFLEKEDKH